MDSVLRVSRADVLRIVAREYPPAVRDDVVALLDRYSCGAGPDDAARTHLAILKLSAGDIERVRAQVGVAIEDFRDVLCPAEYPEFWDLGFVGVDKLSRAAREALKARDWRQYQAWLCRS